MRVALIPTGVLELIALPAALKQLFPGHEFCCVPERTDRHAGRDIPYSSFTSRRHPVVNPRGIKTPVDRLVEQLAAEVEPGRDNDPADVAVLIDDLELCNVDQAEVVVGVVRDAVTAHLRRLGQIRPRLADRVAQALRGKASFHLAVPMIESWLLADPGAPTRAGVPPGRPIRLKPGVDPEHLETDDPAFSADDGSACQELQRRGLRPGRRGRRRATRPMWCFEPDPELPRLRREHHPKAYLAWLCRDPGHKTCTTYRETHGGADALRALDWGAVLGNRDRCAFARSLVADLADALGEPLPPAFEGVQAPSTSRDSLPTEPVLRNL